MDRTSTFADRLWWARHYGPGAQQKGRFGATRLARIVGCAQSLISSLERNNAETSKLNNKFAKALEVDSHWLALGSGTVPDGFDPEQARRGREGMSDGSASEIPLSPRRRFIGVEAPIPGDADMMMKSLIGLFQDYARVAGPMRTKALLGVLEHLSTSGLLFGTQKENNMHALAPTGPKEQPIT